MGQYHWLIAIGDDGDVATLNRQRLGAGAKLVEQSYTWDPDAGAAIPSAYSAALALMILGPWRDRRITVIGDYAEPADDAACGWNGPGHLCDLFGAGRDDTVLAAAVLAEATGFTCRPDAYGGHVASPDDLPDRLARVPRLDGHVVTSSRGEFIRPDAFGSPANPMGSVMLGAVWPTVNVLCSVTDGRGGGDFGLTPPGRWANSTIAMVPTAVVPAGYLDVTDHVAAEMAARTRHWPAGTWVTA